MSGFCNPSRCAVLTQSQRIFVSLLILSFGATIGVSANNGSNQSAKTVIETFYKLYLGPKTNWRPGRPNLVFSKSFNALIDEDTRICKEKAGTDVCGWQADGDVYLDAQEVDPKLTYQNSRILITEPKIGSVDVKLNVYPSLKEGGASYERTITYLMVKENGLWVVDNIIYAKSSSQQQIRDEIDFYSRKKSTASAT